MSPVFENCWPTPDEELLLQAALLNHHSALGTFYNWRNSVELPNLGPGSRKVLPFLISAPYFNKLDVSSQELIREQYRHTWAQNKFRLGVVKPVIRQLADSDIDVILLKGGAQIVYYSKDFGLRPMGDIDLLVKRKNAKAAVEIIRELGWQPESMDLQDFHPLFHAMSFVGKGNSKIDLHWYVHIQDISGDYEAGYWERAIDPNYENTQIKVLSPADQLIHTCVHGLRWSDPSSIRWITDATVIMSEYGPDVDWDHLISRSQKLRVSLVMLKALKYLSSTFAVAVPDGYVQELEMIPVSLIEKLGYYVNTNKPSPIVGDFIKNRILVYLLCIQGQYQFPGFLRYLLELWSVQNLWQVPYEGISRMFRNIKNTIIKQPPES